VLILEIFFENVKLKRRINQKCATRRNRWAARHVAPAQDANDMKRRFTSERIVWISMFKPFFLDAFRKHYPSAYSTLMFQGVIIERSTVRNINYSQWELIDLDEKLHVDSRICIFGTPVELIITQQGHVEKCRFFITVGRAHAPKGINFYLAIYVQKDFKNHIKYRKLSFE